jgi:hypothetical protein
MPDDKTSFQASSIRDNDRHRTIRDFLRAEIGRGFSLSITSACFTFHASDALKEQFICANRLGSK